MYSREHNQMASMMAEIEDSDSDEEVAVKAPPKSSKPTRSWTPKAIEKPSRDSDSDESDDSDQAHRSADSKSSASARGGSFGSGFKADQNPRAAVHNSANTDAKIKKSFIFRPAPRSDKMLQCYIKRDRSGTNMLKPVYQMFLEDGNQFIMAAQKRTKNKTSNYLISLDTAPSDRSSTQVVGKVRSNWSGSEYMIFDHGLNPKKTALESSTRQIHGFINFKYDKMGPGQMVGCIPRVNDGGNAVLMRDYDEAPNDFNSWIDNSQHEKVMIIRNKRPKYDDKAGGHVLNFNGRVTMSSVKNFQLECDDTGDDTILQFGRVSCKSQDQCKCHKNIFNLDFRFPFSPLQAFGIALTSLDGKLADSKGFETLSSFRGKKNK